MINICVLTYIALSTGKPIYMGDKLEKFIIQLGVSIRHLHDPHRLNESRMSKELGRRRFEYSAQGLFSLLKNVKDSENFKVFKKRLNAYLCNECYDLETVTTMDLYLRKPDGLEEHY